MRKLLKNKKRILLVTIILIITIFSFYYIYKSSVNHDALMIKEKYELLNNKEVEGTNEKYQNIFIKRNSPIKNITVKEAVETIENSSGIIFIGYSECPWCRNALPVLIDAAIDTDKEILYLDAKNIRDEYKVENKKLKNTKKGSKYYYELLELLDEYLEEYKVYDKDNNEYNTKEKRIYVPMVVVVKDKEVLGTHTGTVDLKQGQSVFDNLDEEQTKELKLKYLDLIEKMESNMCTMTGC